MSAEKHTPGPWKAVSAIVSAEIEMMEIAEVAHMRVVPAAGGWPAAGTPEDDARLIAAAPDMLEALQNLENDDGSIPAHAWALVQSAISKATGGTQ